MTMQRSGPPWVVSIPPKNSDTGAETWGIAGDSIASFGIRPGSLAGTSSIPGLFHFYASLACSVATTGLLEYRAADMSARFTAPGSTPGPWTPLLRSGRYLLQGGGAGETLDGSVLLDELPATDDSSTITLTPNPPYTAKLWSSVPTWLEIFSGARLEIVNAGAPGVRMSHLSDVLDDLQDRATAAGVVLTRVLIQIGTNDFASGRSPDVAQMQTLLRAAIGKARANGWAPVVLSVPMRSFTGGSDAQIAWRDFSRELPALCASAGAAFIDCWQHFVNPASATAPSTAMSTDGVHPSGAGGFHAAMAIWDAFGGSVAGGQSPLIVNAVDAYNGSTNPGGNLLPGTPAGSSGTAGTGGTASDVATTWDVRRNSGSITIVGTKAAALDGGADWQVLTLAAAAAITDEAKFEYNLGVGVTTVSAGDTVEMIAEIDVPAAAGLRRLGVWLTTVGAARNDSSLWDNFDLGAGFPALPAVAWSGAIRLPRFTIAAGTTSMRVRVFMQTDVSASVVVRVRRVLLRKIL
jgi:lysophospholipase L1-like esterase